MAPEFFEMYPDLADDIACPPTPEIMQPQGGSAFAGFEASGDSQTLILDSTSLSPPGSVQNRIHDNRELDEIFNYGDSRLGTARKTTISPQAMLDAI